jgi:hypothetical protein
MARTPWRQLDPDAAKTLTTMRVEAHWAAQVASAPGTAHLGPDDTYDHTNLGWHDGYDALVGREVEGLRAALRVVDLTWVLLGEGDAVVAATSAVDQTLRQGMTWLGEAIAANGGPAGFLDVGEHRDDLPEHPVGTNAPFTGANALALAELTAWFASAQHALEPFAEHEESTGLRCWPHHFDVATLLLLDTPDADPESARSIGIGMTPGDGEIDEPYFYVTPWPYPETWGGPDLPCGAWRTEGWFGAVLRGSELPREGQAEAVAAFLEAAVAACRGMVASGS